MDSRLLAPACPTLAAVDTWRVSQQMESSVIGDSLPWLCQPGIRPGPWHPPRSPGFLPGPMNSPGFL